MTNTSKLTPINLRQFTGSENWYRHGINRDVTFTDGAKFVADEGGAYWLLDTIAICQVHEKRVSGEGFQLWKLKVNEDRTASLECSDGGGHVSLRHGAERHHRTTLRRKAGRRAARVRTR